MKRNYGPKITFPRGMNGRITRRNGVVVGVSRRHFNVHMNNMHKGVEQVFSKRLIPDRRVSKGDTFSVFQLSVWLVGASLNGKKVFYRDPEEVA